MLRRISLDELPNLLNVWRGEMSIVGPRPPSPTRSSATTTASGGRLAVNPGLTGLAQIRGRNELTWSERIDHDLEYVDTQSPWLDVRICLATVRVGAHAEPGSRATPTTTRWPRPPTGGLTGSLSSTPGARPC